jgi:Dockerin type I domain/A-macroglobulin TED domain/Prenyltransferase and squalene oxidase repeat
MSDPRLIHWRKLSKSLRTVAFTGLLIVSVSLVQQIPPGNAATRASAISNALKWLETNQHADGSYGAYSDPMVAPAGNALWLGFRDIHNVTVAYDFLRNEMQNSTTWFWGNLGSPAEADVPGEILYSFVVSQHVQMLSLSSVVPKLLALQDHNSGFRGYYDSSLGKQVTSSVDTSMALLGLVNAGSISVRNETSAVNYLLSLQNGDGSFNLTKTLSSTSLYSLGPEPIAITGLVLLALRDASFISSEPHVSSALNYLGKVALTNFGGHVYAAALSALVFTEYYLPTQAANAVNFILSQEDSSGGFRDISRSSTGDNALDTGWATVAMDLGGLFGDVNLDGVVNVFDLSLVGSHFGAVAGSSDYLPNTDLNADGVVNISDLVIVGSNFGKTPASL